MEFQNNKLENDFLNLLLHEARRLGGAKGPSDALEHAKTARCLVLQSFK